MISLYYLELRILSRVITMQKIKSPLVAALGAALVLLAACMLLVNPAAADTACGAWSDSDGYSGYSCCHDGTLDVGGNYVKYTGGQALASLDEGGTNMLATLCSPATPPTCNQKCGYGYSASNFNSFMGDSCLFATSSYGSSTGVSNPSSGQCMVCGWLFWEASVVDPCAAGSTNTSPDVTPTPTPPIIPTITPNPSPTGNGGSGGNVPIVPVVTLGAVGTISTLSPNYTKIVDKSAYENYLSNGTLSILTTPFLSLWDSIGNTIQNFFLTIENILLIPFSYIASNVGVVTTDIHTAIDSIAASLKYFITIISTSLNAIPDVWKALVSVGLGVDVAYIILKGRVGNS